MQGNGLTKIKKKKQNTLKYTGNALYRRRPFLARLLFYMLPDSFKVVTLEMLIFKITVKFKKLKKNRILAQQKCVPK